MYYALERIRSICTFPFVFIMHYASTSVFLSTVGPTSHTCIYGHGGVLFGKARKHDFQTSEGLAASISTEPIRPSRGAFSDQITSDRVQTSLR